MKTAFAAAAIAVLALASTTPADAKGCIKGAIVGGVAGHYAGHHGVLGAAAGCLYGRHRANEQDNQQTQGQDNPNGRPRAIRGMRRGRSEGGVGRCRRVGKGAKRRAHRRSATSS